MRCRVPTRPPAEMSRCAPSAEGDGGAWPWGSWNEKKNAGRFGRIEESGNSTAGGLGGGDARVPRDRRGLQAALAGARDVEAGTGPNPARRELPAEGAIGWQQLAHFPSSFPFFFFSVPCCSATPSAPPRVLGPGRRRSLSSPASSSFPFICPRFISYLRNRDLHGATYHGPCSGGGRRSHESPFLQSWAPPWSRSSKL